MPRIARLVVPGVPHHVTQRGNNRRQVFFSPQDYRLYLKLFREYATLHQLSLLGYCLMPNHVHLIVIPHHPHSLARALGRTHSDYARVANIHAGTMGHFWQARFYSCPLDDLHQWHALAYVERNPLRAGLVANPTQYPWSSAPTRFGARDVSRMLDQSFWHASHDPDSWRQMLMEQSGDDSLTLRIRDATRTGRPLGGDAFLTRLASLYPQLRPRRTSKGDSRL